MKKADGYDTDISLGYELTNVPIVVPEETKRRARINIIEMLDYDAPGAREIFEMLGLL